MILVEAEIDAALARLAWLRDEYGEEDLDYLTFAPIVERLAIVVEAVDDREAV